MKLIRECGHRTAPVPRRLAIPWLRTHKPLWCHLCRKHSPIVDKAPAHDLPRAG